MFDTLIVNPLINVLVAIYGVVSSVAIPYSLGFSIIFLTILVRVILYPLTRAQINVQKKMQLMQPHLSKIKEKHKGDMKAQQEATMALYRDHGFNPAAGCLPVIVQFPLFIGLYHVLLKITEFEKVTDLNSLLYFEDIKLKALWSLDFFGLPLGQKPSELISVLGPVILLVPVLTGVLQFILSKMMAPVVDKKPVLPRDKKPDDFAASFQKQIMYVLPVMIGFFSYSFSIGLSLYWNTFTIFGIMQQYKEAGLGGLESLLRKKK